jgi:hypothetical protein
MSDEIDMTDYWPVEGCWSAYELGVKHGREDEYWTEHSPNWFDEEELDEYHDGYVEGRVGR